MHECKRCGHKWESRVEKPVACPACKSYRWEVGGKRPVVAKGFPSEKSTSAVQNIEEVEEVEFDIEPPSDEPFDYSDTPYDDCPPEEKKRRRSEALAKRGIAKKGFS